MRIQPRTAPINAEIRPPGSKSITNRALLCAALAKGDSVLTGALKSDDTDVMIDSLRKLGIQILESGHELKVIGCNRNIPNQSVDLFVGNSGTTIRFLTAALSVSGGFYRLTGIDRMHERPIGDLVDTLIELGCNVKSQSQGGCPPVWIDTERLDGGVASLKGNLSSQYLSGILMASPLASGEVEIQIEGPLVSLPYVKMTIDVMRSFGVECIPNARLDRFVVNAGQTYEGCRYRIEPDASSASYFFAAAAIAGGTVKVMGLGKDSIQGDIVFAKCLAGMGCQVDFSDDSISVTGPATRSIEITMSDFSDTAQTLAVVALFVPGATKISGIAHNRVKETDRIGNLAIELRKLGAKVVESTDGLLISAENLKGASIDTYDDHRMAMSFSLAGLKIPGVVIKDPDCVGKTYPNFFSDLAGL